MFENYLNTALRNLIRHKLFSFINIAGLAVGLAAFIIILLFVRDEFAWDDHWANGENIYRVETTIEFPVREDRPTSSTVDPLKDIFLDTYSEIEDIARYMSFSITLRKDGELYNQPIALAEANFTKFFGQKYIEGDPETALLDLNNVVISERVAKKYFGDETALDQTLSFRIGGEFRPFRVAGVIEDPVVDTHMPVEVILPYNREYLVGSRWFTEDWRFAIWAMYVRVQEGTDVDALQADLPNLVNRHMPKNVGGQETGAERGMRLDLVSIKDIYLYSNTAAGDAQTLYGFVFIAFLILAIAIANFLNLSMARVAYRAREVAMRKVVGATRGQIVRQFLSESIFLAVLALVIALTIVELSLPYYNAFLSVVVDLSLMNEPSLLLLFVVLGIGVGLSAGSAHSLYFSLLKPRDVLYNNSSPNPGGNMLRMGLVVAQFSISVALMTIAFYVNKQTEYASRLDLGFNPENLIVVSGTNNDKSEAFKNRILENPFVLSVGRSSDVPTEGSEDRLQMRPVTGGDLVTLDGLPTGPDFFNAYQIPLLAGRYLTEDEQDTLRKRNSQTGYNQSANIVINAAGARLLGFNDPTSAVGHSASVNLSTDTSFEARIVGVVKDFHFDSLKAVIRPGIYYIDYVRQSDMSVRVDAVNRDAAITAITQAWREIYPDSLLQYRDMANLVERQYQTDTRLGDVLTLFTVLATIISCLGLYGLASFTVERRTKEIGLRKVLGANLKDIVGLLLWQFSKPILIANLIAWPVAYYFVSDWLNGYAYRIDLDAMPFILTGLLALVIGWATVAGHAFLVANIKPSKTLRYE
ncbi:ABC transporter permease [Kordiimonas aquimaris]|uniref:ABC transporter permease n=1 Tax=Kordiimonas aquimaris TaxID=707591 RepID=UPI0021CDEE17|nr:ABC transporter permease [Kordiimonas aquimaris]